jgi:hypothetical protein
MPKFVQHESGLYCTDTDCLRNTPVFYKVVDLNALHDMVLGLGLCLSCAITTACEVPENKAGGVQIIVRHNFTKEDHKEDE